MNVLYQKLAQSNTISNPILHIYKDSWQMQNKKKVILILRNYLICEKKQVV